MIPPYQIMYTNRYERTASRFLKKHPEVRTPYHKTIALLELDPFHPSLRLHRLKGKLSDLYSISINISYRITLEFIIQEKRIIPVMIGSHDQAYR